MAATYIKDVKIPEFNSSVQSPELLAVDAVEKKALVNIKADHKTIILVQNSAATAKTVTFLHGNAVQGVCDMTRTLAGNATEFFILESGRFSDNGLVHIVGETVDIKVGAIRLP